MTGTRRARLLLDEMLSGTIAARLRDHNLDVTAVVEEPALLSTPDEDLLAFATDQRRVLVTINIADFAPIANDWRRVGRTHHGLVYVANRTFPQDRSFVGAITNALVSLCASGAAPRPGTEVFLARLDGRTGRGAVKD
ncbi:MAG: hypothetical protein EPO13_10680 [Actinomycetota bacterium]|nr:MAG: hypothetical protein EPO13_10680 [Actinomycetota bacterium]